MAVQDQHAQLGERLKTDLLKAWQTGHGGSAETVFLLQGAAGLALMIPKGLLPAEMDVIRIAGTGSRVIHAYVRELLLLVASDLTEQVGEFARQQIEEIIPLVDLRAGWVIAFFRFKMGSGEHEQGEKHA